MDKPFNAYLENTNISLKKINEIIIDKNREIIESLFFILFVISNDNNIQKLDLIMNEDYYKEFEILFKQKVSSLKADKVINFAIFDYLISKFDKLIQFNLEFNSLDYFIFFKILYFIRKNANLKILKISFFTNLINYSPQYLYKLYKKIMEKNEIKDSNTYSLNSFILNELLIHYEDNLSVLFELIKMKNLEEICFIFNTPEIISVKQVYQEIILKFIINILFLFSDQKFKIKKLIIISPKTILSLNSSSNNENPKDIIYINKNNNIEKLSIHAQFYNSNIDSLISYNLIDLKICDIDILIFKKLIKYLCSYSFYKKHL